MRFEESESLLSPCPPTGDAAACAAAARAAAARATAAVANSAGEEAVVLGLLVRRRAALRSNECCLPRAREVAPRGAAAARPPLGDADADDAPAVAAGVGDGADAGALA